MDNRADVTNSRIWTDSRFFLESVPSFAQNFVSPGDKATSKIQMVESVP